MPVAETLVEKALRDAVVRAGGLCIKLPAILYRGIPDRMVLLPMGRIFFIELKKDGGRTEPGRAKVQSAFREFLRGIGFNSLVIQGKEEVERFIHEQVSPAVSLPDRIVPPEVPKRPTRRGRQVAVDDGAPTNGGTSEPVVHPPALRGE
jgi:hypothetical protein